MNQNPFASFLDSPEANFLPDAFNSLFIADIDVLESEAGQVNNVNRQHDEDFMSGGIERIERAILEDEVGTLPGKSTPQANQSKYSYGGNPILQMMLEGKITLPDGTIVDTQRYFREVAEGFGAIGVRFGDVIRKDQATVTIGKGYGAQSWIPGTKLAINGLPTRCTITYLDADGNAVHQTFRFKVSEELNRTEIRVPASANIPAGASVILHGIEYDHTRPHNLAKLTRPLKVTNLQQPTPTKTIYLSDAIDSFSRNVMRGTVSQVDFHSEPLILREGGSIQIQKLKNNPDIAVRVDSSELEIIEPNKSQEIIVVSSTFTTTYSYYLHLPGYIEECNLAEGYSNSSYQSFAWIETSKGERKLVRIIQREYYQEGPVLTNIDSCKEGFSILGVYSISLES